MIRIGKGGRKDRYESHVKPHLKEIPEWYGLLNEGQIAKRLGVGRTSFEKYKREHPELREALKGGAEKLITDLKITLKEKAQGFYRTERKTIIRDEGGKKVKIIEEHEKYFPPDTGAAHLLLKNLDPEWREDDQTRVELKKQKLALEKEKAERDNW